MTQTETTHEATSEAAARCAWVRRPVMRCAWIQDGDPDSDSWASDCGNMFQLNDGSPQDNGMKFCCYCGRPLVGNTMFDAAGIIYLENSDGEHCWRISAHPTLDNPATLLEHFQTHSFLWPPGTKFIGAEVWICQNS